MKVRYWMTGLHFPWQVWCSVIVDVPVLGIVHCNLFIQSISPLDMIRLFIRSFPSFPRERFITDLPHYLQQCHPESWEGQLVVHWDISSIDILLNIKCDITDSGIVEDRLKYYAWRSLEINIGDLNCLNIWYPKALWWKLM